MRVDDVAGNILLAIPSAEAMRTSGKRRPSVCAGPAI